MSRRPKYTRWVEPPAFCTRATFYAQAAADRLLIGRVEKWPEYLALRAYVWNPARCEYDRRPRCLLPADLIPYPAAIRAHLDKWLHLAQNAEKRRDHNAAAACRQNAARCAAMLLNPPSVPV